MPASAPAATTAASHLKFRRVILHPPITSRSPAARTFSQPFHASNGRASASGSARQRLQRRAARVFRLGAELLLDPEQLVVLGGAVGTRQRAGLDLSAI